MITYRDESGNSLDKEIYRVAVAITTAIDEVKVSDQAVAIYLGMLVNDLNEKNYCNCGKCNDERFLQLFLSSYMAQKRLQNKGSLLKDLKSRHTGLLRRITDGN